MHFFIQLRILSSVYCFSSAMFKIPLSVSPQRIVGSFLVDFDVAVHVEVSFRRSEKPVVIFYESLQRHAIHFRVESQSDTHEKLMVVTLNPIPFRSREGAE